MDKIIEWINNHKKQALLMLLAFPFVIFLPVVMILFKNEAPYTFLTAPWEAGELLTFCGGALTFWGTVTLGFVAILQSYSSQKEGRKLQLAQSNYFKKEYLDRDIEKTKQAVFNMLADCILEPIKFTINNLSMSNHIPDIYELQKSRQRAFISSLKLEGIPYFIQCKNECLTCNNCDVGSKSIDFRTALLDFKNYYYNNFINDLLSLYDSCIEIISKKRNDTQLREKMNENLALIEKISHEIVSENEKYSKLHISYYSTLPFEHNKLIQMKNDNIQIYIKKNELIRSNLYVESEQEKDIGEVRSKLLDMIHTRYNELKSKAINFIFQFEKENKQTYEILEKSLTSKT